MSEPPIFILRTAEEGAMHERQKILETLDRWASDLEGLQSSGMTTSKRLRTVSEVIRRGEHHRPIETAPRRRMGR
jgi:hypothetical protein